MAETVGDAQQQQQQQQQSQQQQQQQSQQQPPLQRPQWIPDERDSFISWLRGEFAAANAVIDALCQHLHVIGLPGEYDYVLSSIHHRRFNWNSVLHMQQYYSVAEVIMSLHQVSLKKQQRQMQLGKPMLLGEPPLQVGNPNILPGDAAKENGRQQQSGTSFLPDKLDDVPSPKEASVGKKEEAKPRAAKYVIGLEEIEGQQVNVLDGLELHENVFDNKEVSEIALSLTAKSSEKGPAKEPSGKDMIQFGTIPSEILAEEQESSTCFREETAEAMPTFLQSVVDRLVKLRVVPEDKPPDTCSVSVLEAGDYMPPHNHHSFDQPIVILSLESESSFAFGRVLRTKNNGEIDGPFKLTLPVGSVLVLQGSSAQAVQCAVLPAEKARILITFGRVFRRIPTPIPQAIFSPSRLASMDSLGFVHGYPPLRTVITPPPTLVPVSSTMIRLPIQSQVAQGVPYPPNMVSAAATAAAAASGGWSTSPRAVGVGVPPTTIGTGVFLPPNGTVVYSHQQMNGGNGVTGSQPQQHQQQNQQQHHQQQQQHHQQQHQNQQQQHHLHHQQQHQQHHQQQQQQQHRSRTGAGYF